MLRSPIFRASFLLAFVLLFLAGCTLSSEPVPAGPIETGPLPGEASSLIPAELPSAANGAAIYAEHCASCHGEKGQGNGVMAAAVTQQGGALPDLSDPTLAYSRSPQDWFRTITLGDAQALMPPWGDTLTDAERWDVTYYLYTFSKPQDELNWGQKVYTATCAECHGADGSQNGLNDLGAMAALSPQDIYDNYVMNGTDGVHTFSSALSDEDAWAVTFYARTFAYDSSLEVAQAATPTPIPTPTAQPTGETTAGATPEAGQETPQPTVEATPTEQPSTATAGVVTGLVDNGTTGATLPAGLEVQLQGMALDATGNISEFLSRSTTVGPDGSFRFDSLPFDNAQSAYIVHVVYDGVEFANGAVVDPLNPSMDLPITIYENTTDPSVLTVEAMHVIIREHPDALLVVELLVFSNSSDKVYVSPEPVAGGRRGSVAIVVPPDAYGLSFEQGELGGRFVSNGALIYDTQQVYPGQGSHTISVSYILPYTGSREISIPIIYPTSVINVLADPTVQVRSDLLAASGSQTVQDQAYQKYSAQDVAAGQTLTLEISKAVQLMDVLRIVLAVVLGLIVIGGVGYWFFIGRKRRAARLEGRAPLAADQQDLINQIAALDESFEAGKINRVEYETRRAELKAELAEKIQDRE